MSDRDNTDNSEGSGFQDIPSREVKTGQRSVFPELPGREITSAQDSSRTDETRAAFDKAFPPGKRTVAATTDDLNLSSGGDLRSASINDVGPQGNVGGRAKTTDDIDDSRRAGLKFEQSQYKAPKTGVFAMTKLAASSIKSAVSDKSNPFKDLGSASDVLDRAKSTPDHELSIFDRIAMKHVDPNSSRQDQLAQISQTKARFSSSKKLTFASKLASAIDKTFNASARKELSRRADMRSQATGKAKSPEATKAKPPPASQPKDG